MNKPEGNALTLVAVLIAAALAGRISPGGPWTEAVAGVVLLLVLFAYDRGGYRDTWQSLAFGAVAGYCVVPIGGAALTIPALRSPAPETWLPLIWGGATIVLCAMDRVRMNTRAMTIRPVEMEPGPVAQAPTPTPTLVRRAAEPEPQPEQPAMKIPAGAGKPATIYLNLVGEGMAVLRTVQAEHMGKDFYRIVDQVPEGEKWEFQPGEIVRCRKQRLSTGKGLVAFEEAPRAR